MRLSSTIVMFGLVLGASGCNDKMHLHPPDGNRDAYEPPWWTPMPGEAPNWDIQIAVTPFDFSANRAMYVVDLWNVATATTIDYGDGSPITVPAGPHAGKVAELKARGAKVICRVGTGAIRLSDPDAPKFPGYAATPNERPTAPAAGSVIGWSTDDPRERFLDIRTSRRPMWESRLWKRFDLAKDLGCDGIEHDRIDIVSYENSPGGISDSGFMVQTTDQSSFGIAVAKQAHDRELSAGFQNGTTNPLIDLFAGEFDWLLLERCGEFSECDFARKFLDLRKAIFAVDYTTDSDGAPQSMTVTCANQVAKMINDGIVKDVALSSTFRHQCFP